MIAVEAVEELGGPLPLRLFAFANVLKRLGHQAVERIADQLLDRALAERLRLPSLVFHPVRSAFRE